MKTVITRDKDGKLKVNTNSLWDLYEALFDNCRTEEEIDFIYKRLDGLHEIIADIKSTELEKERQAENIKVS